MLVAELSVVSQRLSNISHRVFWDPIMHNLALSLEIWYIVVVYLEVCGLLMPLDWIHISYTLCQFAYPDSYCSVFYTF
jgi:hypothetical protein